MLVLPLPGAPNRNSPRPELIAGPSRSSIRWLISRSSKARVQVLRRGMLLGQRLGLDAGDVVARATPAPRRSRCSARPVAPGPLAAQVGQLVQVVVHRRRAAMDHQLVVLQLPQQLVDQHERQLDLVGDVAARPDRRGTRATSESATRLRFRTDRLPATTAARAARTHPLRHRTGGPRRVPRAEPSATWAGACVKRLIRCRRPLSFSSSPSRSARSREPAPWRPGLPRDRSAGQCRRSCGRVGTGYRTQAMQTWPVASLSRTRDIGNRTRTQAGIGNLGRIPLLVKQSAAGCIGLYRPCRAIARRNDLPTPARGRPRCARHRPPEHMLHGRRRDRSTRG